MHDLPDRVEDVHFAGRCVRDLPDKRQTSVAPPVRRQRLEARFEERDRAAVKGRITPWILLGADNLVVVVASGDDVGYAFPARAGRRSKLKLAWASSTSTSP